MLAKWQHDLTKVTSGLKSSTEMPRSRAGRRHGPGVRCGDRAGFAPNEIKENGAQERTLDLTIGQRIDQQQP
jgi:hypothetical protein